MQITVGKLISLLIALVYAIGIVVEADGITIDLGAACVGLLLPLALIWFPEELGSFTGSVGRGGYIDTQTPPILVSTMGWIFLLGLPVLVYFINR